MVDEFRSQPYDQRESQNLGARQYAKEVLWGSLPLLSGVAALTFGLATKFKSRFLFLDGSPSITYHVQEVLFNKASRHALGTHILPTDEIARLDPFNRIVPEANRLGFTRGFWNFTKGAEVGAIPTIYHFWRQQEKTRLDLVPSRDRLAAISASGIKPSDEELRAENASLKQQLAYVNRHAPSHQAHAFQHEGTVAEAQRHTLR